MEFHEKLQQLRKQKDITQEELATSLYVSRTAVSKWESGRGYPSIESLKAIAKFYGITIDSLLSGDELLCIAEEDHWEKQGHFRDLLFGLLDISAALLLFLPFFAQKQQGIIQEVSLLRLTEVAPYLKAAYLLFVLGIIVSGVGMLSLQNCRRAFWLRYKHKLSLALNAGGILIFIISLQPYAAVYLFLFLAIKVLMLIKKQ